MRENNFKRKEKPVLQKHMVFIWRGGAGKRLCSGVDFMAAGKSWEINRNYSRGIAACI